MKTCRTHLRDISHYFDISTPLGKLSRHKMNEMVVAMRESGLATNSISSYVRVTTTFLNWCRRKKYCDVEMPKYKPEETVKETHTDEDLLVLLERPSPSCRFSVYRTWVIINFLLNSGCRAATVRSIKNYDVDLEQHQVIKQEGSGHPPSPPGYFPPKMTKHVCKIHDAGISGSYDAFFPPAQI